MLLVSNKEVIFYGCLFECFYSDLRCANIFSSKSLIIEIDQNLFIIFFSSNNVAQRKIARYKKI